MASALRKCWTVAAKGFQQNLQYSASHLISTVASAVFGVIYVYVWKSVTPPQGFAGYTVLDIVHYICFSQVIMWLSEFALRVHARIAEALRTGNVATELTRPMDFFTYHMATGLGSQVYSLIFRGLPVAFMLAVFTFYIPKHAVTWLWTLGSMAVAGYLAVLLSYIVGVTGFWTTEVRTAWWVVSSLSLGLGGASMPLEVLPPAIGRIAMASPFACLVFYPARIYLEMSGPMPLLYGLVWAAVLTLVAKGLTAAARKKLEVQGG